MDAVISSPGHFCDDLDRNVLIVHSSGTTGLPKAIPQPHKYLLGYSTCHIRTEAENIGGLNMSTLPLYHVRAEVSETGSYTVAYLYIGVRHARSYAFSEYWEALLVTFRADRAYRQLYHFGTQCDSPDAESHDCPTYLRGDDCSS